MEQVGQRAWADLERVEQVGQGGVDQPGGSSSTWAAIRLAIMAGWTHIYRSGKKTTGMAR